MSSSEEAWFQVEPAAGEDQQQEEQDAYADLPALDPAFGQKGAYSVSTGAALYRLALATFLCL